jgi:hypothetical protein
MEQLQVFLKHFQELEHEFGEGDHEYNWFVLRGVSLYNHSFSHCLETQTQTHLPPPWPSND